jgi:hypothetical protein
MAVRVTYLAIALGGACGAFAALVHSPTPPPVAAHSPAPAASQLQRPNAELRRPPGAARLPAITSETHQLSALPPAVPVASSNAAPSASAPARASASPPPAASDSTPPPDTKEALLRAEMHCDQKDAAACILAARGYETGSAGASDPDKATKYRKIALTLWISQCDHNSAAACATLSDMYRTGRGVPQNEKNADALVTRTRELCHYNDAPVCHELPPAP